MSAHGYHALFLAQDGALYSVGQNNGGQIGDGTFTNRVVPVRVVKGTYTGTTFLGDNPANRIRSILAAPVHSVVLMQDGTLFSFGANAFGQLGDGTAADKPIPFRVVKGAYTGTTHLGDNPANPVVSILGIGRSLSGAITEGSTIAITADGYLYSFGRNTDGQLGDNSITNRLIPVRVLNFGLSGFLNVLEVGAPSLKTVPANQITYTSARLNAMANANGNASKISFEYGLTTAYGSEIFIPDSLRGLNDSFKFAMITGLLPHKTYHFRVKAVNSKGIKYGANRTFITTAATTAHSNSGEHTIILDSTGIVYTFGRNTAGQLGDGTFIDKAIPVKVLKGAYPGTTFLGDNPANPIIAVASGNMHNLALAKDGTVYSFGLNSVGQLGNGTLVNQSIPVRVLKGLYVGTTFLGDNPANPIVEISTGLSHSMALAKDGTMYTFGDNSIGQLGNGTITNASTPIRVLKGAYTGATFIGDNVNNPIIKIAGGVFHSMALAADGRVFTFGYNPTGQLGDGSALSKNTPVLVLKGAYVGLTHLGDDNANPIVSIAAGYLHSMALAADGTLYNFGGNPNGQLGNGTVTSSLTPVRAIKGAYTGTTFLGDNIANPIVDIASGHYHSLALGSNGTIYSFGSNNRGQLGDNSVIDKSSPVRMLEGKYVGTTFLGDKSSNRVVSISAGQQHTIVTTADGYLFTNGMNNYGQLGINTLIDTPQPFIVSGVGNVGNLNVLGNVNAPSVRTVPANRITYTSATLNSIVNANVQATTVQFEYGLTNAYGSIVTSTGLLTGDEDSFRKATITGLMPHKTYHFRVRAINAVDTTFGMDMVLITGSESSRIANWASHSILVDSAGIVYTFGEGSLGQLGDGASLARTTPVKVLKGAYAGTTYLGDNPANPIIAVSTGYRFSLALAADGTVYSFGLNGHGQLGDGTNANASVPVKVLKGAYAGTTFLGDNPLDPIISIKNGAEHSAALSLSGKVYTFGNSFYGQLGDGTVVPKNLPVLAIKGSYAGTTNLGDRLNNPIIAIQSGLYNVLALAADGTLYAFGWNFYGQLGDSTIVQRNAPIRVKKGLYNGSINLGDNINNPIGSLASGSTHSVALSLDGKVYSFGYGFGGAMGNGSFTDQPTPVIVLKGQYPGTTYLGDDTANKIRCISGGGYHSLALADDGRVYAFGENSNGQLGDSTLIKKNTPIIMLKGAYSGSTFLGDKSTNPIVSVSSGEAYSIAISADGYVYTLGKNNLGQLGDNTTTNRILPLLAHGVGDTGNINVLRNQKVPTLKTVPATKVTFTSATLNGIVNPNVLATTVSFEYGLTLAYGTTVNVPGTILFDADSFRKVNISGLIPHRTYNYRIRATNAAGTSFGPNRTFITGGASTISSSSPDHSVIVDSNGIVYTTGFNNFGQLGDGTTTNRNLPVRVLKGAYNGTTYLGDNPANPILAVVAGLAHTMALAADGTIYSFGNNADGQLGDGTNTNSLIPIRVVKGAYPGTTYLGDNLNKAIVSISAGGNSNSVLVSDGTMYTFGRNSNGQLGDNTTISKSSPVQVLEGAYDGATYLGDYSANPIIAISNGTNHVTALAADGTVFSFGLNGNGQLGNGNTIDQLIPAKVLEGLYAGTTYLGDNFSNPIIAVSSGASHTMTLASDGTVYTYGNNFSGQLGNNSVVQSVIPVRVLRGAYVGTTFLGDNAANPIVSIAAGSFHNYALGANGTIYSFGYNAFGQLGDNTLTNRLTPFRALKGAYIGTTFIGDNAANPIVSISGNTYRSIAIARDGFVFGFGQNTVGQLGDNTLVNKSIPVQMLGVALMGNLNVLTASLAPKSQTAIATRITYTSANINGIVNANNLNTTVSFEYGLTTAYGTTIAVPGLRTGDKDTFISTRISGLIPHRVYHFRIKSTNADGTNNGRDMQFMSGGSSSRFANGNTHSILVDSTGIVYTFGRNLVGQLGDGSATNRNIPIRVLKGAYTGTTYLGDNPANPIIAVSANNDNSLALAADGTVYTFGLNANGQMGIGNTTDQSLPVKMLKGAYAGTTYLGDNPSNPVIAANAGIAYTTVLTADGTVFTCGLNSLGQLGDGTNTQQLTPVQVLKGLYAGTTYLGDNKGNPIVAIASGGDHNLALAADGRLFSFGKNQFGSLGDNTTTNRNTPVGVLKGVYIGSSHLGDNFANPIIAISSANQYSATLAADGTMYTFGDNFFGNLGDGTTVGKLTPVRTIKGAYAGTTFLGDAPANPIIAISSYLSFTSAISANGLVYSFGYNNFGQLGDNTVIQRNSPVVVLKGAYSGTANLGDAVGNPIVSVSSSQYSSMAIAADGYVYTIGLNNYGQLGDNTNIDKLVPTIARGVDTVDFINVLLNSKAPAVRTVPANRITFTGATLNALIDANVSRATVRFEYGLTTAYGTTLTLPGYTFGDVDSFRKVNITGLLPHKTYHFRVKATNAKGTTFGNDMSFITGGMTTSYSGRGTHSLILDSFGLVYAFGANSDGQLGDGTTIQRLKPVRVLKGAYNGTTYLGDNPANPIIAVAAGGVHSVALAADGTMYTFGNGAEYALGDNTAIDKTTPVRVLKGLYTGTTFLGDNALNPVIAISAGFRHTIALTADGTVYTFGNNGFDLVGDGVVGGVRATPVRVLKGVYTGATYLGDNPTDPIISVHAGSSYNVVLSAKGLVYSFGSNVYGSIGNGTTTTALLPVLMLKGAYSGTTYLGDNIADPAVALSANGYSTNIKTANGGLYAVGSNNYGQLGDNTVVNRLTPIRILKGAYTGTTFLGDNPTNKIQSIFSTLTASVALAENGTLYSFGSNVTGQLGDGTFTTRITPVRTLKGAYAGTTFLGDNPTNPVVSLASLGDLTGNSPPEGGFIATTADGYLYSMGFNITGQLGINTNANVNLPTRVLNVGMIDYLNVLDRGAPKCFTSMANQITYTSARLNAIVNAYTFNTTVSFEYGLTTSYGSEITIPGVLTRGEDSFRTAVIAGLTPHKTYHYRVKAVNAKGTSYGEDMTFITSAATTAYACNGEHTLVVDSNGIVYGFGRNTEGQLGDGTIVNKSLPVKVLKGAYVGTTYLGDNPANPILSITTGEFHSLALAADGSVYSFGYNVYGQLGDNTNVNKSLPVRVVKGAYAGTTNLGDNLNNPILSVLAGWGYSLALAKDGTIYSFGDNTYGQLGNGNITASLVPVRAIKGAYRGTTFLGDNPMNPIVKISGGVDHAMALAADGTVYTYGRNTEGQLGNGAIVNSSVPIKVLKGLYSGATYLGDNLANPITAISAGRYHNVALAANGNVFSFGLNTFGQLGDGTVTQRTTPVIVLKGSYAGTTNLGDNIANPIVSIASGWYHSISLAADGSVYTFGYNVDGELGDNTNVNKTTPIRVLKGAYGGTTYLGDKLNNPIVMIGAGEGHNIATDAKGYLYSFGWNPYGQLGNNSLVSRNIPVIVGGINNVGNLNVLENYEAPIVRTVPANRITFTGATLNALVNASVLPTTVSFEYGLTTAYGNIVNVPGVVVGDADSFRKAAITGLTPHKTYHYRVRAINAADTSYGMDMTFISGGASSRYQSNGMHSIVVDSQNIVYTYRFNSTGQLGDGTAIQKNIPIKVLKGPISGTTYLETIQPIQSLLLRKAFNIH
ncbi:MAG: hypothetical protein IPK03_09800 [Bacteroidetes bacterium]|nr:hypothetical protein [Bacteroidota bacterium]